MGLLVHVNIFRLRRTFVGVVSIAKLLVRQLLPHSTPCYAYAMLLLRLQTCSGLTCYLCKLMVPLPPTIIRHCHSLSTLPINAANCSHATLMLSYCFIHCRVMLSLSFCQITLPLSCCSAVVMLVYCWWAS